MVRAPPADLGEIPVVCCHALIAVTNEIQKIGCFQEVFTLWPYFHSFQVYAKYEQFDLTDRKDFIKSTVKEVCLSVFSLLGRAVFIALSSPSSLAWIGDPSPVNSAAVVQRGHAATIVAIVLFLFMVIMTPASLSPPPR